jgi:hypothetical protein
MKFAATTPPSFYNGMMQTVGTYIGEAADKLWCRACPPGTYGLVSGATSRESATTWDGTALDPGCMPCANGTFGPYWGATSCEVGAVFCLLLLVWFGLVWLL